MAGRYEENTTTIDGTQNELFASATLAYADTNEHALMATPEELIYYLDAILEIKIDTVAATTAQSLTFAIATSNYELTGANAVAELTNEYWTSKSITLNAGEDTYYYRIAIPANEINGKFLYAKYAYGADPTGDPTVEVKLNLI